ncbi:MAG: NADH-quinone oxidoreductase subunit J family protein, partial [Thermomicrobiales bacterium]
MHPETIVFFILSAVAILTAIGMVAAANPVHSAIFLFICFFNVAGVFIQLGADFLAAVQVIVYAGAILVLVLFVLMLVDPDDLPEFHGARPVQRNVGVLLGLVLLLEVGAAIVSRTIMGQQGNADAATVAFVGGNTQAVGNLLNSQYMIAFEIVSLVLLVGVIGAIVLALPERLVDHERRGTISLGHPRGTDYALPTGPR